MNDPIVLWRKEEILTQSSQIFENSNKFATKFKLLTTNSEDILTYWPLKNTLFHVL